MKSNIQNIRSCNIRAALDSENKIVKFYYVTFGFRNDYGEVFHPGCSLRTIRENFENIKYFKNHEIEDTPGIVLELGEDNIGCWARCEVIENSCGKDTWVEYVKKQITQHSFGFNYVFDAVKYDEKTDTLNIYDFDLMEVSALNGWGADKNTKVIQLNNGKLIERAEFINQFRAKQPEKQPKINVDFLKIINNLQIN